MVDFDNMKNIKLNDEESGNYQGYGSQQQNNLHNIQMQYDNYNQQEQQQQQQQQQKNSGSFFSFLTVEYYQPYFDVSQQEVSKRIIEGFKPIKPVFFEIARTNPDLYGPFWIYSTLIFMIAAAGNFSRYLGGETQYKFGFVPVAAGLIYGFGIVVPIVLCFAMRIFGSSVEYIQIICLYGYSMVCFIPVTLLCVIPFGVWQLAFLIYGLVNSTVFLMINLWNELGKYIDKRRYFCIGVVVGTQIVLILMFKFYFFSQIYKE